ncbi:Tetratricopeptide repeat protein [Planctomycetes bacterium MalM25]|nr:Tetratricopeptide repeat protein [Planctomycetes bacterium MalM25]
MEASRQRLLPILATILVAAPCAAEESGVIRLPSWVEPDDALGPRPVAHESAPAPGQATRSFDLGELMTAFEEPAPLKPAPAVRLASATEGPSAERLVRQLEHAASEARTAHALTRLLSRYTSTRRELVEQEAEGLVQRVDEVGSWAHDARGRLRADEGRTQSATDDFRAALAIDTANTSARHGLAVSLAESGFVLEALEQFSRVLLEEPQSVEARRNRAQLHLSRGRPESAIADLDAALELPITGTRERGNLLRLRATAFQSAGRLRESATDLNEVIRLDPRNAAAYTLRGHVFAEGGFYDQAISDYQSALHADAGSAEAYRSLAWVLATCPEERLRDPEMAIESAFRARRLLGHDDFLVLDASAAAHAAAGDYAEAVRLQQRALLVAGDAPTAEAERRLRDYKASRPYVAERQRLTPPR